MANLRVLRPVLPILLGAAGMLTLSMGIRQTFGLFLQPLTRDIGLSVSDFTLAGASFNNPNQQLEINNQQSTI